MPNIYTVGTLNAAGRIKRPLETTQYKRKIIKCSWKLNWNEHNYAKLLYTLCCMMKKRPQSTGVKTALRSLQAIVLNLGKIDPLSLLNGGWGSEYEPQYKKMQSRQIQNWPCCRW